MAFCAKCGNNIEDANFCSKCGTPAGAVGVAETASKPKTVTVGQVKKCPSCGEPIGSFQARCVCGYEISDVEISKELLAFTEGLERARKNKEVNEFIRDFLIPKTRESLLEFAFYISGRVKGIGVNDDSAKIEEIKLFIGKLEEIYDKAQVALPGDTASLTLIKKQLDTAKQILKKSKRNDAILTLVAFLIFGGLIFGLVMWIRSCVG